MTYLKINKVFIRTHVLNFRRVFTFFLLHSCFLQIPEEIEKPPELTFSGAALKQDGSMANIFSRKDLLVSVNSETEDATNYLEKETLLLKEPYSIRWQILKENGEILPQCAYYNCEKPFAEISTGNVAEFSIKLASHLEPEVYEIEILFYLQKHTAKPSASFKRKFFLATPPLLEDNLEINIHYNASNTSSTSVTVQNEMVSQTYFSSSQNLIPAQLSFIIKSQVGYYYSFGYFQINKLPSWVQTILLDGNADLRENNDPSQTLSNKKAVVQSDPVNKRTTITNFIVVLQSPAPVKFEQSVLELILQDEFAQQRRLEITFHLDPH